MKKTILEKIINLIREEGPTMTSGSNPQGFSSAADSKGPRAGFDPVMKKMKRRKNTIGLWASSLKGKKGESK